MISGADSQNSRPKLRLGSRSEAFRDKIDKFLDRAGMTPTAFGKEAVGDGNFVADLRAGRMPSLRLVEKVDQFIGTYKVPAQ